MRLLSTRVFMLFLPPVVLAYGWVTEEHVNVSAICVMLFLSGFFAMYVPCLLFSSRNLVHFSSPNLVPFSSPSVPLRFPFCSALPLTLALGCDVLISL